MNKNLNTSMANKNLILKINEAFSKGNTDFILEKLDDDVNWNIVGMPIINGKRNFLETIKLMESAAGGCPDFTIKKVIAEGEYVVVESSGEASGKAGMFNPSCCDIYRIKNGKIQELTSYIVDVTLNNNYSDE